jgi:hypothetical protein
MTRAMIKTATIFFVFILFPFCKELPTVSLNCRAGRAKQQIIAVAYETGANCQGDALPAGSDVGQFSLIGVCHSPSNIKTFESVGSDNMQATS